MKLTPQQIETVASWIRSGASLSDVQKRLAAELNVHLTYLDVRFLVDDLNLTLVDKPKPVPAQPASQAHKAPASDESFDEDYVGAEDQPLPADPTGTLPEGKVSVEVDPIARPGALVSGSVVFSDGQNAQWYLDQTGRLGLVPPSAGYKPSESDILAFQRQLQTAMERMGY